MPRNKYQVADILPPASQFGRGECVIYQGEVLTSDGVNWTSQTGPLSYTAATMADPATLGAGVIIDVILDNGAVMQRQKVGAVIQDLTNLRKSAQTIITIGDSLSSSQLGPVQSGNNLINYDAGWLNWINLYSDSRFRLITTIGPNGGAVLLGGINGGGVHGQLTSEMKGRIFIDAIHYKPSIISILGGTNDVITSATVGDIFSNLTYMYDSVRAAGIDLWVITIPPKSGVTVDINLKVLALNELIRGYAKTNYGVVLLDAHSVMVDPLSATGSAKANYLRSDNTHPTALAWRAFAKSVYQDLTSRYQDCTPRIISAASNKSVNNSSKHVLNYTFMQGSSGGISNGSGPVPSGWQSFGGVTAVSTIAARTDGRGNDWTVAMTAAGGAVGGTLRTNDSTKTQLVPGKCYEGEIYIKNVGTSGVLRQMVYCSYTVDGVSYQAQAMMTADDQVSHYSQADSDGFMCYRTPVFKIPEGLAISAFTLVVDLYFSSAGGATVTLSVPDVREVSEF